MNCFQGIFPTHRPNSTSVTSPALADSFFTTSTTWEVHEVCIPFDYTMNASFKGSYSVSVSFLLTFYFSPKSFNFLVFFSYSFFTNALKVSLILLTSHEPRSWGAGRDSRILGRLYQPQRSGQKKLALETASLKL